MKWNFIKVFIVIVVLSATVQITETKADDCNTQCGAEFNSCSQDCSNIFNVCLSGGEPAATCVEKSSSCPVKCNNQFSSCGASCGSGGGGGGQIGGSDTSGAKSVDSFKNISDKLGKVAPGFYGDVAQKSFEQMIGGYIKTGLALVGVIFLMLMVYGGYTWMLARGDETEAKKAKDTITMAAIGMAVVLIAYVITYFILSYALQSSGLGT